MSMGHEKEFSRTSNVSNQNSVKDTSSPAAVLNILDNTSLRTNPFGANISGDNAYKRAERISAALHLVTNHVPETEALRTQIRESALSLLDSILELRSGFRAPVSEKGQVAQATLRRLITLVRLLAIAGYISAQNASALSEALDELGSLLVVAQKSGLAEQITISRDDLVPRTTTVPAPKPRREVVHEPDMTVVPVKKETSYVSDQSLKNVPVDARAERILDILKMGGVLGIRDISLNLPQYSEKMIQRELADLVDAGRVRKSGEKRWSRYQLIS